MEVSAYVRIPARTIQFWKYTKFVGGACKLEGTQDARGVFTGDRIPTSKIGKTSDIVCR